VERCGNKFHVLDSQARDKEVQVQLLLEKIDRMVEINRRPREIQERLYSQVREGLRMRGGKQQGEDIEMLVMQDMRTRQNQWVTTVVPIGKCSALTRLNDELGCKIACLWQRFNEDNCK
jgi:hypothetical protein